MRAIFIVRNQETASQKRYPVLMERVSLPKYGIKHDINPGWKCEVDISNLCITYETFQGSVYKVTFTEDCLDYLLEMSMTENLRVVHENNNQPLKTPPGRTRNRYNNRYERLLFLNEEFETKFQCLFRCDVYGDILDLGNNFFNGKEHVWFCDYFL